MRRNGDMYHITHVKTATFMKLPSTCINLFGVLNLWDYLSELLKASCRPAQGHFQPASGLQFTNLSQLPRQAQQSYFMNSHHDRGRGMAHLISLSPSTPLSANAAFRWDWQSFEKTNVRSIHPQCRNYSWILRHRRSGRFEKTLTPSQTSAWLSFISGVVIRGVHLASSKLTDKEACSVHRYDLVVMLSSRATLTSQSHFKSRLSTPARVSRSGTRQSQPVVEGRRSVAGVLGPTSVSSLKLKKYNRDRLVFPESGTVRRNPAKSRLTTPSSAFFSSPRFPAGWGRAALLVSVDHAVARGDCQEHLQAGDQETSAEPRWRPASAA